MLSTGVQRHASAFRFHIHATTPHTHFMRGCVFLRRRQRPTIRTTAPRKIHRRRYSLNRTRNPLKSTSTHKNRIHMYVLCVVVSYPDPHRGRVTDQKVNRIHEYDFRRDSLREREKILFKVRFVRAGVRVRLFPHRIYNF